MAGGVGTALDREHRWPKPLRRRALRAVLWSSALWAAGSAVSASFILRYWVQDLGARGTVLAWIMALPALLGLLRMATGYLVALAGSARRLYLLASTLAYTLLGLLATLVLPWWNFDSRWPLACFVFLLTVHQVIEHIAGVGYWSWLGEVVPKRIRGRFFGLRQRVQLLVAVPVGLGMSWALDWWRRTASAASYPISWGYAGAVLAGALLFFGSLVPMWLWVPGRPAALPPAQAARNWWEPFRDRRFRHLLWFAAWFSLANGITQAAQGRLPYVLGVQLVWLSAMRTYLKLGQGALARRIGILCDRWGNRPVMVASQVLVATSVLFYCLALAGDWRWLWGGWTAWIFYVGLNVGLPSLMLKLAPEEQRAGYLGAYWATSGVVFAASSMAGGVLLDLWGAEDSWVLLRLGLEGFGLLFLLGFLLRLATAWWLWRLEEPEALSLTQLLRRLLPQRTVAPIPATAPLGPELRKEKDHRMET